MNSILVVGLATVDLIYYLEKLPNKGIKYVVLAGEEEILSKSLTVKDMKKGDQNKMSVEDLISLVL